MISVLWVLQYFQCQLLKCFYFVMTQWSTDFTCCKSVRNGAWGQSLSKRWKEGDEDVQMEFLWEEDSRTQNCEKYYRHRGNWGCDEKVQTEMALKRRMQVQCWLGQNKCQVGGGEDCSCLQVEEDLAEHCICRHASAESWPSGRRRPIKMKGHRMAWVEPSSIWNTTLKPKIINCKRDTYNRPT